MTQLTATGGTPPYTWSTVTTLPAGIALSSGGLLSGTPSAAASGSFTVRLTDSAGATTTADVWIDAISLATAVPPVVEQLDFSVSIIAEVEMSGSDLAIAPLVLEIVPEVEFQLSTLNVIKGRAAARGSVQPQGLVVSRAGARGFVQPQGLVVGRAGARGYVVGESVNTPAIGRAAARGTVQLQGLAVGRAVARGRVSEVVPVYQAWTPQNQASYSYFGSETMSKLADGLKPPGNLAGMLASASGGARVFVHVRLTAGGLSTLSTVSIWSGQFNGGPYPDNAPSGFKIHSGFVTTDTSVLYTGTLNTVTDARQDFSPNISVPQDFTISFSGHTANVAIREVEFYGYT
jgi:hypothetical protein